ncbi:MAG: cell division protein ZipA C-terminal FtsZ-binding domain-containing protein [Gammaproteobacteria bacterium]
MNELRLVLLLVGVAAGVAVYLWSRRTPPRDAGREHRVEPSLRDPGADLADVSPAPEAGTGQGPSVPEPAPESVPAATPPPVAPTGNPEKIVVVHAVTGAGSGVTLARVREMLEADGLEFGHYGIFHRPAPGRAETRPVFSVANLREPGSFDLERDVDAEIEGLTFFMVLPGPVAGVEAFDEMLDGARRIAAGLGAELLDDAHSSLTRQAATHLREEIVDFEHRRALGRDASDRR